MARFHVVHSHSCRLPIVYVPPHFDVGVGLYSRHNLKEIYNVLLIDNWRFRFLNLKLIFDFVARKDKMYFEINVSAKITKSLA